MSFLFPLFAVLLQQQAPTQNAAQGGWGPLFWLWFAVIVILLALFVWRMVRPRRPQPPIDPNLR